jgi:hypothetical protein
MPFFIFIILFSFLSSAWAQEVHFFGSLDYAKTTTQNDVEYHGIQNRYGAASLSSAGINVSAKVDDKSRALVQVLHSPQPNKIVLDLIQFERSFKYDIKIRVGRQRLPIFLKSEVIQVKALYPWTTAPVEVYNQIPVTAYTGGSAEKTFGDFRLQVYTGDVNDEFYSGVSKTDAKSRQLMGSRLNFYRGNFEAYVHTLKAQATVAISSSAPILAQPGVSGTFKVTPQIKNLETYTTGFIWDDSRWLVMSEFLHMHSSDAILKELDAGYASLGYHLNEKLLFLGTFSNEFSRTSNIAPSKGTTYDLTIQYQVDTNTVLKLGASHVNYRRYVTASNLSPTGTADTGNGYSGAPGNNFNVYDLQLAFVF